MIYRYNDKKNSGLEYFFFFYKPTEPVVTQFNLQLQYIQILVHTVQYRVPVVISAK
jgi:hypothetical protein